MGLTFKNETFRDNCTFSNSPAGIRRFPFPFHEDKYMYAVNIEPHVPGLKGSVFEFPFDIDEHYVSEMQTGRWCSKRIPAVARHCRI